MRNTLILCQHCGKRHFKGSGIQQEHEQLMNKTTRATTMDNPLAELTGGGHIVSRDNMDVLEKYNVYRWMTDTMHNSSEAYGDAELLYYSTETGQRELQRRKESSPYVRKTIESLGDAIERAPNENPIVIAEEDMQNFKEMAAQGADKLLEEEPVEKNDKQVSAFLIEQSLEQLRQLTVDEVETVSHFTSNGSSIVRGDADEYLDNPEEIKHTLTTNILSAMKKMEPRDDIPKLYRGTTKERLPVHNIGQRFTLSEDGLPLCTSTSEDVASSFGHNGIPVVLNMEIEQATMIIPAAVSAWSYKEQEVILDGNTEFEIVDIQPIYSTFNPDLQIWETYTIRQVV